MTNDLARRDFLKASAAVAGAAASQRVFLRRDRQRRADRGADGGQAVDPRAGRFQLTISSSAPSRPMASRSRRRRAAPISARRCTMSGACRCGWNRRRAAAQRTLMLDYGYTPEVLLNNMELIGVDPVKDRRADRQPRPLRSFRRPARLPRQIPRQAAGRHQALCRRRGQFLPSRQPPRRPRASSPISARSIAASSPRKRSRPCCAKRRP